MPKTKGFVPQAQIKQWQKEDAALAKKESAIVARRTSIQAMITHAQALSSPEIDSGSAPHKRRITGRKKKRVAPNAALPISAAEAPEDRRRGRRSEWSAFISGYVLQKARAVPYAELKQEIAKNPVLAEKLARSDKGFYHAISRLDKSGSFKAYRGHMFSKDAFAQFQFDLKSGRIRDIKTPNSAHHSPMGDATETLMLTRPNGLESGNIIWELRKNPDFAAAIEKNKTHPYNVLARLVKDKKLIKRGKRYFSAQIETAPESPGAVSNLFGEGGSSSNKGRGAA